MSDSKAAKAAAKALRQSNNEWSNKYFAIALAAWSESGDLASMEESKNVAGAIAGMAMVIIGVSTITYFMRANYELSSNPTEFVIRVYDGFTRDLYKAAQQAPERSLRCSVDGPYGQVPNFKYFDKVVLIAGGSGASFTFAIALDLIESSSSKVKSIDFIWVVRHQESLEWYSQELKQLQAHPEVNVLIHVTRTASSSDLSPPTLPGSQDEKGSVLRETPESEAPLAVFTNDLEKGAHRPSTLKTSPVSVIRPGRPDIGSLLEAIVLARSDEDDRVIVGACGPNELMSVTREAVHQELRHDRLPITLYTEAS
ncbi:hypothetical protein APSETT444_009756 [Aspergillus pseudonomiae]